MCRTWLVGTTVSSSPIRRITSILPTSANAPPARRRGITSSRVQVGKDRAERHEADILAEQFSARRRPRVRGKRQRLVDCLCSFKADTTNTTKRLATQTVAL